jgi:hypothetical protein
MNTFKGTPGEWRTFTDDANQPCVVANDRALAFLPPKHPDTEANLKLLAASKQMMEALQAILAREEVKRNLGIPQIEKKLFDNAKAALSAALD